MPENFPAPAPADPPTPDTWGGHGRPDRDRPDEGSSTSRWIAWIAAILSFAAVVWLQQPGKDPAPDPATDPNEVVAEAAAPESLAAGSEQLRLVGNIYLRLHDAWGFKAEGPPLSDQFEPLVTNEVDRVRYVIIAAELDGADAATAMIEEKPVTSDAVAADMETLHRIYTDGPAAVESAAAERLIERHGWYGRVAMTFGAGENDDAREDLLAGGTALLTLGLGLIVGLGVAVIAGTVCFIIAGIAVFGRRPPWKFVPPAPGGSVYLETFALFMVAFLLAKVAIGFLAPRIGPAAIGLQWLLLLAAFWPLVRGVRWSEHRRAIGWHTGQGVFREIACGVFGYLAALPLFALALVMVVIMLMLRQRVGAEEPPPQNPMVELVAGGSPLVVFIFLTLATLWAPLAEESVFRGGLYRHFRGVMPWALAGLVSAVAFALVHNYGLMMTPPLIALGFAFAAMREWRGSLIAPMTAHLLHNGTIMLILLTVVSLTK